jgi:hypothetical protein
LEIAMRADLYRQAPLRELSAWLRTHPESWWSVDGDSVLMGRISFPCPSEKLAAALDRRDGTVFVRDPESKVAGTHVSVADLERLAADPADGRVLQLRWTENGPDWLLVEDQEAAELSRRDTTAERR